MQRIQEQRLKGNAVKRAEVILGQSRKDKEKKT